MLKQTFFWSILSCKFTHQMPQHPLETGCFDSHSHTAAPHYSLHAFQSGVRGGNRKSEEGNETVKKMGSDKCKFSMVRYGTVRYGTVQYGMVWCVLVWCGVVCRRRCYQMALMAGMVLHTGKCKPGGLCTLTLDHGRQCASGHRHTGRSRGRTSPGCYAARTPFCLQ